MASKGGLPAQPLTHSSRKFLPVSGYRVLSLPQLLLDKHLSRKLLAPPFSSPAPSLPCPPFCLYLSLSLHFSVSVLHRTQSHIAHTPVSIHLHFCNTAQLIHSDTHTHIHIQNTWAYQHVTTHAHICIHAHAIYV